jgi:hypothetical protein
MHIIALRTDVMFISPFADFPSGIYFIGSIHTLCVERFRYGFGKSSITPFVCPTCYVEIQLICQYFIVRVLVVKGGKNGCIMENTTQKAVDSLTVLQCIINERNI